MNSLQFKYSNSNSNKEFDLKHTDKDEMELENNSKHANRSTEQAESEDSIRSIYFYKQSYFRADLDGDIIPRLRFKDSPPSSDSYCIDTLWKDKADSTTLTLTGGNSGFSEADDQPNCNGSLPVDEDVGLSYDSYKWEANDAYSCKIFGPSCEINCNVLSGHFNVDDGNCYELKALQKLCIKVDFKYLDGLPASEAVVVSTVKVTNGCYIGGAVGMYQAVPLQV